jgi:hypothetical protein
VFVTGNEAKSRLSFRNLNRNTKPSSSQGMFSRSENVVSRESEISISISKAVSISTDKGILDRSPTTTQDSCQTTVQDAVSKLNKNSSEAIGDPRQGFMGWGCIPHNWLIIQNHGFCF